MKTKVVSGGASSNQCKEIKWHTHQGKPEFRTFHSVCIVSKKKGIGSAYELGIKNSFGEIMVTMDADFSHPPDVLNQMVKEAQKGFVVSGSRFFDKKDFQTISYRRIGSIILNKWAKFFLKTGVRDNTNGFIAISKENLVKINELGNKFNIRVFNRTLYGIPLLGIASYIGIPTKEIRSIYKFRKIGNPKINFFDGIKIVLSSMIYTIRLFYLRQ